MTAIERLPVPSLPNGTVRRKIPAPFARPSVSIGGASDPQQRREWRMVLACDIAEGDIIPGVGRVHTVCETVDAPDLASVLSMPDATYHTEWTVTVEGGVANTRVYQGNDQVWAFTVTTTDG